MANVLKDILKTDFKHALEGLVECSQKSIDLKYFLHHPAFFFSEDQS